MSPVREVAPTMRPFCRTSSSVFTPAACQATSTAADDTALPIMVMSGPENCAFDSAPANSVSNTSAEFTAPKAVPSCGARLAR